jgi:hypothetical protein
VLSTSRLNISMTSLTPCWPAAASPFSVARPSNIARALSATALTTSAPRRTLLSHSTEVTPAAAQIEGNTSIGVGRSASYLPP